MVDDRHLQASHNLHVDNPQSAAVSALLDPILTGAHRSFGVWSATSNSMALWGWNVALSDLIVTFSAALGRTNTPQLPPPMEDFLVQLCGLQNAYGHESNSKPLAGIEQGSVRRVGEPTTILPHFGSWVVHFANVDEHHGQGEGNVKHHRKRQVVEGIPTFPMCEVTNSGLAAPPSELCDVSHHDTSDGKFQCIERLVQLFVDLGPSYLQEPADKQRPASGADKGR